MTTEQEALAAAAQVIAEDLQRQQLERTPTEAARAALGSDATPERIAAWIARFRFSGWQE